MGGLGLSLDLRRQHLQGRGLIMGILSKLLGNLRERLTYYVCLHPAG